jgi:hypothetical protein
MTKHHEQQHHQQQGEYRQHEGEYREPRGIEPNYMKSQAEARVERMTWFLLVLIFALVDILRQGGATSIPNWIVPLSGCAVLIGSGLYQYGRHWRVSPITWLAGAMLGMLAFINLYFSPNQNFLGVSLIVFAGVILVGLVTGET